jgi:hypothetical protein
MHQFYGYVLLVAGIGFFLLGVYPFIASGFGSLESIMFVAESGVFACLLTRTGYRMSKGKYS